jgi:hypothetical protein
MWGHRLEHPEIEPPKPAPKVPAADPPPEKRWGSRFPQMLPHSSEIPHRIEFSSGAYIPVAGQTEVRVEKVIERTTHYRETAQALRRAWHTLNEARKRVQPPNLARECGQVADEIFSVLQDAERETDPL